MTKLKHKESSLLKVIPLYVKPEYFYLTLYIAFYSYVFFKMDAFLPNMLFLGDWGPVLIPFLLRLTANCFQNYV